MAKAYWVTTYRSITNPDALAAYAKLAGPAIAAAGGTFVVRGMPAEAYEAGLKQRTVVIEIREPRQGAGRARHARLPGRAQGARNRRGRARYARG